MNFLSAALISSTKKSVQGITRRRSTCSHSRDVIRLKMSCAKLNPKPMAKVVRHSHQQCISIMALLYWVFISVSTVGWPVLHAQAADRLRFRCDELETTETNDDVYCTVSQMYVNYSTVVDCDVYPLERSKLRVIKFYNSRMLYIPAGLLRLFGDVRDMDISHSEIVDISRSSFEGAKHLVYLTMSHNNVTELRASIFVEATSLFMLDLSHNAIQTVDKFAFVNAQSMSRLNLAHNLIEVLPVILFRDMKFLDQIHLNDNRLSVIDPGLFAGNVHLQRIVLDNNRIRTLDMTVFTKCAHLELIHVSGNMLQQLNASVLPPKFKTLALNNNSLSELYLNNNMEVLEAANNRIRSLSIENPLAMRSLLLSNNCLADLSNITAMEKLEVLDLSQNRIGRLNISSLVRLKSLTLLNLAQTELRDLNYGSFAGQRELKILDVSYNGLNDINLDILSPYLGRLERLHLDGNNLTDVGGLFQVHLPSMFPVLNTLGISNNNFNCTYLTKVLRTLASYKIKLPVDPDPASQNGTHVSGIACTIGTVANAASNGEQAGGGFSGSVGGYAHFAFQRTDDDDAERNAARDDNRRWSRQKLLAALDRQFGNGEDRLTSSAVATSVDDAEMRSMRSRFAESQMHEQLLRENLFTLKLIVVLLCLSGLAVLVFQCVAFYRKNKHVWPVPVTSMYRSTTTMNTLQCSLETSASQ